MSSEKLITLTCALDLVGWRTTGELIFTDARAGYFSNMFPTFTIDFSCDLGATERCYFPVGYRPICRGKTAALVTLLC